MARYFFHTEDGRCFCDEHGSELATLDAVRARAVQSFVEMQQVLSAEIWSEGGLRMIVTDDTGLTLATLELVVVNAPAFAQR